MGGDNMFPTKMTEKSRISTLLQKLYPLSTDKKLIRLGPKGDGGYLLPDDLSGIEACFSLGVGGTSDFELACAERGMKVFMADKSVKGPATNHQAFSFIPKFIGAISNDDFITLDQFVNTSLPQPNAELMLQIDIEGFEYEVFLSTSEQLMKRFRIIIAEFHELDNLWNKPYFGLVSQAFEKILQTHTCVHIHPNNYWRTLNKDGIEIPKLLEFTFLRKDRIQESSYATQFPHPLDSDNTPKQPLVLPKCWYRSE